METQRASFSLGRSSLWLLLLGLVVPSASAQDLSYREAVLRAVDQFNERSSEANLYRLLELDPPPEQDVSWGGGWEGDLSPDILGTVALFIKAGSLVRKALFPLRGFPPLPGNLPRPGSSPSTRLPVLASLLWEQAPCTPGSGSLDFWELQGWGGHRLCEVTSLLMSSLHLGVSLPGGALSAWRLQ